MPNKVVKGKIRELSRKERRDQEPKWKIGKGEYHQSKFLKKCTRLGKPPQ